MTRTELLLLLILTVVVLRPIGRASVTAYPIRWKPSSSDVQVVGPLIFWANPDAQTVVEGGFGPAYIKLNDCTVGDRYNWQCQVIEPGSSEFQTMDNGYYTDWCSGTACDGTQTRSLWYPAWCWRAGPLRCLGLE